MKSSHPILLASASPRRRELLAQLVENFEVAAADIDGIMFHVCLGRRRWPGIVRVVAGCRCWALIRLSCWMMKSYASRNQEWKPRACWVDCRGALTRCTQASPWCLTLKRSWKRSISPLLHSLKCHRRGLPCIAGLMSPWTRRVHTQCRVELVSS